MRNIDVKWNVNEIKEGGKNFIKGDQNRTIISKNMTDQSVKFINCLIHIIVKDHSEQ